MPDYAIVSIAYQFHRVGKLLSSYRVEYMEPDTFPADLTLITHKGTFGHHWNWMAGDTQNDGEGACLEEVDPTTPEAQKQLLWDRPANVYKTVLQAALPLEDAPVDAELVKDEKVYRVVHDLFEIVSYDITGLSRDLAFSCGLAWEADGIGIREILTDSSYPNQYKDSALSEIIRVAQEWSHPPPLTLANLHPTPPKEPKDEGHLLFLYSWDGHLDTYTQEFDSYWEYIGPIYDADLHALSQRIEERIRAEGQEDKDKEGKT